MRIANKILWALVALTVPMAAVAQSSSINSFSPYTMYGLGDLSSQGSTYLRSMGGIGVAYRTPGKINYLNPAASTAGVQRSFLINLGMEGQNYYLSTEDAKSSYNSFNIRDIAVQLPLSRIMGFGLSVTPMSTVGYRISQSEMDADMGQINYTYEGNGGITQLKAGFGLALGKRLSVGAEMVYYHGNIDRSFNIVLQPITDPNSQNSIYSSVNSKVSKVLANFGVQYDAIANDKYMLTLGATWQPSGALNPQITRIVPTGTIPGTYGTDTVSYASYMENMKMPSMITAGVFLHTMKMALGFDYSYQNWAINNPGSSMAEDNVAYRNTNSFKIGGEYTPNRMDVRKFMNRLSYRVGLRYSDYYMTFGGHSVADKAITFGVGIPLRTIGMSSINVGFEVGTRGTVRYGLVKENYFKVAVGLSLFGEDYWFVKPKYD